jgi:hypothetical protein
MKRAVRRLTDVLRRVFLEEVRPLHGDDFLIRPTPAEVALRTDQESRRSPSINNLGIGDDESQRA